MIITPPKNKKNVNQLDFRLKHILYQTFILRVNIKLFFLSFKKTIEITEWILVKVNLI